MTARASGRLVSTISLEPLLQEPDRVGDGAFRRLAASWSRAALSGFAPIAAAGPGVLNRRARWFIEKVRPWAWSASPSADLEGRHLLAMASHRAPASE
jgi:hypothetical protein